MRLARACVGAMRRAARRCVAVARAPACSRSFRLATAPRRVFRGFCTSLERGPEASSAEAVAVNGFEASSVEPLVDTDIDNRDESEVVDMDGEAPFCDPSTYQHDNPGALNQGVYFAVFEDRGRQHKVVPEDLLMVDRLANYNVGDQVVFDDVMLVGSANHTVVGRPYVPNSSVVATVEEQTHTRKVRVFKKRRRKASSKKTIGHRSNVTMLRIEDVKLGDVVQEAIEA